MEISTTEDSFNLSSNGLYSYTTKGHVRRDRIESPTNINCALTLPGTGYRKRREAIYYGKDKGVKYHIHELLYVAFFTKHPNVKIVNEWWIQNPGTLTDSVTGQFN